MSTTLSAGPSDFTTAIVGPLLGGLIVRVVAVCVLGDVQDFFDFRDSLLDEDFDALLLGDVNHSTSLAAAAEADIDLVVLHVDE